ncbi:MAG: helix-turn-helix domain-containing protein [Lachnospiraceae bacterium]|nr:helix-turn-helix domain-containing protein [Lachnospiraceae bacterium]
MSIGKRIAERRKELQITQEGLGEAVGVSAQAVSRWENDWNLPDMDNIRDVAKALKISVGSLIGESRVEYEWELRDQMFSGEHMFTRLKTIAETEGLKQTYRALYYVRDLHKDQYRKELKYSDARIPYIVHPLMMACHVQAMGIGDDETLAVTLLHDVCEDCGIDPSELPFSDTVKDAVRLLTKAYPEGLTKEEATVQYYTAIGENKTASIVKVIDRCNNVSTMALSFDREKLSEYIEETENYVIPLLTKIKREAPEYNNAAFLVKYQLLSVLESLKAMLLE